MMSLILKILSFLLDREIERLVTEDFGRYRWAVELRAELESALIKRGIL